MGLIARYIHTFLDATGWSFDEIGVHDLAGASAGGFKGYLERSGTAARVTVHETAEELIRGSDLIVFATIAAEPHAAAELDVVAEDPVRFVAQDIAWKTEVGNPLHEQPPGPVVLIEQHHLVAAQPQLVGAGQARGAGADHGDALSRGFADRRARGLR